MACHVSMTFSSLVIAQCGHGTVANTSHALKSTFCFKVGFTDARGTAQVVQQSTKFPVRPITNRRQQSGGLLVGRSAFRLHVLLRQPLTGVTCGTPI